MGGEDKWSDSQSVKKLPPYIRRYFLGEASAMYHQLITAEVQIVQDKSGGYRPGRYGERYFRVVSSNPVWYSRLYTEYNPRKAKRRGGKVARERESIRKAVKLAESGKEVILNKKRKKRRDSFNRRVLKGLDAIIHQKDVNLPDERHRHQPGLLQERLRSLILDRLLTGYQDMEGPVPPIDDFKVLSYFDAEIEEGSYHKPNEPSGPDGMSSEFADRESSEESVPF